MQLHPHDLGALLEKQIHSPKSSAPKVLNISGGLKNSMSLAQLSLWCENRFGKHKVSPETKTRLFDIPWLVLDSSRAKKAWNWKPKIGLQEILNEIAGFADKNPNWLKICSPL